MEEWKPVRDYERVYEVSNTGKVRRIGAGHHAAVVGRHLTPGPDSDGYLMVMLCDAKSGRKPKLARVHRLVLESFIGPQSGMDVRHLNGEPGDNRLENLAYGTASDNAMDRMRHGRIYGGERHYNSKLTEAQVYHIRHLRRLGACVDQIAKWFGVTKSPISAIACGKTWRHLGQAVPNVVKRMPTRTPVRHFRVLGRPV